MSFPNGTEMTAFGESAFKACKKLRTVEIPDTIGEISVGVFSETTSLESARIPAKVQEIRPNAFAGSGVITVTFAPDSHLTRVCNAAFQGCTRLRNIEIPEKTEWLDVYSFEGCRCLTKAAMKIPPGTMIGYSALNFAGRGGGGG
jgi:hypothetical protein